MRCRSCQRSFGEGGSCRAAAGAGLRLEPTGGTRPGVCVCVCVCFPGDTEGSVVPPPLPFGGSQPGPTALALRRGAGVTQAAQLGWTGGRFTPLPHTARAGRAASAGRTGPSRFGRGGWKSEVQLHGSTAGAGGSWGGEGRGNNYLEGTRRRRGSDFRDARDFASFRAKSAMTQARITCKISRTAPSPRTGVSSPQVGEAAGQELSAASPGGQPARRGAGSGGEGYTWLQERR